MPEGPSTDNHTEADARQESPQPVLLEPNLKDLDTMRATIIDAGGTTAGIWLSYLFVLFYLLVAASGVTHRDLFFERAVKLPFLSVDLPLKGFFWFGPFLFLVVHIYVLVHLALLAGKIDVFNQTLHKKIDDLDANTSLRQQLPNNIFVQLLAGPNKVRAGIIGFLLRLVVWISVVIGPVALLVFFQIQFLPYHDEPITWWQRFAVLIDVGLLWTLWPTIARGEAIRKARRHIRLGITAIATIATLVPILFVFLVATFPGEWLEETLANVPLVKSLHSFFVAGEVDVVARKQKSIWSNRLIVPQLDVIDHARFDTEAKIDSLPESASLRMRDLRGAVLIGATLRSVDFTGADLRAARLDHADLRGAKLACEEVSLKGEPVPAESCVKLQAAVLDRANLRGARLSGAQLQGASLEGAQLDGASLANAQLQMASLMDAELHGATFYGANLQMARMFGADLRAAELDYSQLQSANLETADLRGASLMGAQLQGADLDRANLSSATLAGAFVWRADARPGKYKEASIKVENTQVYNIEFGPKFVCKDPKKIMSDVCDWSNTDYKSLKRQLDEQVSLNGRRQEIERLMERLDPSTPLDGEAEMEQRWIVLARSSPSIPQYESGLTRELIHVGCEPTGAPYALEAIILHVDPSSVVTPFQSRHSLSKLAAALLDKEHCPGARKLSDSSEAKLKEFLKTP